MATTNLDSADLKAVLAGGLIKEDVMDQIFDISDITLEFTSRAGKATHDNSYSEWTSDKRQAPNLANKVVDGADITQNDTQVGKRLGNHGQISVKAVQVSSRADASDTIGRARESAYQIMMRGDELRRDVEAISLSGQGSVADDGATVAGQTASVFAQASVNKNLGATGTIGGFNTGTKLFPAVGLGTKRGITETILKNMFQQVWMGGGEGANVLMSTPGVIRQIADFFFTSGAHIATLVEDVGTSANGATAKGAVNLWKTQFGPVVELVANRLQPNPATAVGNILLGDFDYIQLSFQRGYETELLAKTGLSEKWMMSVDWQVQVTCPDCIGAIMDIDEAVAMVA